MPHSFGNISETFGREPGLLDWRFNAWAKYDNYRQDRRLPRQVSKWLGLYGGYHYATRRIRSVEQVEIDGVPQRLPASQENRLDSGLAGIRLNFARSLTVSLDAEIGRADRPFFPISERDYHGFNARVRYKSHLCHDLLDAHSSL